MINLVKKDCCSGCAACYSVCPRNAITMSADYTGFLYPIIDNVKCIECGLCQKVCPVLSPIQTIVDSLPKAYIVQNLDEKIRLQSTSGGAFSAIAELVLQNGGVVFGAAMDDGFTVRHTVAKTVEELEKFRNSKYVQSEIGDSFRLAKEYLEREVQVLYSGTPCQIHGLLGYLQKSYDNLITVDLVCHSVPSPAVFRKYMELQQRKYPNVEKIIFRDKARGYDYSTMALYGRDKNGDEKCLYREGSEMDLWFRSFLPGLCDRENCYECIFQEYPRKSDITIWDCFNVGEINKEFDDNKGTTSVVAWSNKGNRLLEDNSLIRICEVDVCNFLNKINRENFRKIKVDRSKMYQDLYRMSAEEFFDKYRKTNIKIRVKSLARFVVYKLGLHSVVKKIIK